MLSRESCAKPVQVTSVATGCTATKPMVVDKYNHSMNAVDKANQYTVYYSFIRRSHKWWRKLFWLYEVSYILYSTSVPNAMSHLRFRQSIVESLVSQHIMTAPPRPLPGRPRKRLAVASGYPERFNKKLGHYLKKLGLQRQCVVCSGTTQGERVQTGFVCKGCPTNPSLCIDICFEAYHAQ